MPASGAGRNQLLTRIRSFFPPDRTSRQGAGAGWATTHCSITHHLTCTWYVNRRMDGWTDEWTDGQTDRPTDGREGGWTDRLFPHLVDFIFKNNVQQFNKGIKIIGSLSLTSHQLLNAFSSFLRLNLSSWSHHRFLFLFFISSFSSLFITKITVLECNE